MANKKITDYTEVLAAGVDDFLDISVDLGGGVYDTRKIKASNIGGASPLTTKGDLFTYDTADARLPIGTDGQALIADSAEATGLRWGTVSADNMATADLTLTGDRTHDLDGNVLKFDNGQITIEGSGSTNATTSILIQNSLSTQLLKIDNSGGFALGTGATYTDELNVSIGNAAIATGARAIAIGDGATAEVEEQIAIGYNANGGGGSNVKSITIGSNTTNGQYGISIGNDAVGSQYGVSIGWNADSGSQSGISIGLNSEANSNSVSIGQSSYANGYTVALGSNAKANTSQSGLAIGNGAISDAFGSMTFYTGYLNQTRTNSTTNSAEFYLGINTGATFRFGQSVDGWLNTTGSFGFGTITPSASAVVDLSSTTKGFLPPRMTTTEKNAISTPATGLVVFDNTLAKLCVYTGSAWETVTSA